DDSSDKYFGMENFGYTCYCNSVLQCLYYSRDFREAVINYPALDKPRPRRTSIVGQQPHAFTEAVRRAAAEAAATAAASPSKKDRKKVEPEPAPVPARLPPRGDETVLVEQKKKTALTTGPIINLDHSLAHEYAMEENMFTSLKDIFHAIAENRFNTGVVSPAKLVEVLKRENELFRSSMHQDAHEFFNFLLNEVVDNIDRHGGGGAATRWVHDLFEGLLTSETKCLTCENTSRRDEVFLDLSIDLDQHSSVTSCLRQFSASEMLCESNKFHCDCCGGLQEAQKRMKVKRLPRILALHLKRFKYTEDMQRNMKLFHRVVYPHHLRLFNTTDDAETPDRLYELYALVVHIGGGPYHGHYVSIVKTEHAGWVLYDDEMVERVDSNYASNFFGDKSGQACAYILFYQEITEEAYEAARR
ncbi:uncharacterized protein V1510DRAFT_349687, partial [Dipodascopsis tothii]|uniref:uncharacterized protein n=1 Tax=Dipodascopsis tothii TaxID=44089 RepID=UPI0034CD5D0E